MHSASVPTLVQFGAGSIGRGFIADLFSRAGWRIVFIEVSVPVLTALRRSGSYRVIAVEGDTEQVHEVRQVEVVDGRDLEAVALAVAGADLVSTAVGLAVLPLLAPGLAAGLRRRTSPLDVLVCENGAYAAENLRAAMLAAVPAEEREAIGKRLGTVRTAIGRMIPAAPSSDHLDLRVEPYAHLPVERSAFRGPIPVVAGLEPRADFTLVLQQKLYLHNLTHACLAYAGLARGLATIPDCVADPEVAARARTAGDEVAEALGRRHGRAVRDECRVLLDDLFRRYRNRALGDPLVRVARDPWRKLAGDDRLVGAARLCLAEGVVPFAISAHILIACAYEPAAEEPRAAEWQALRTSGWRSQLNTVSGLDAEETLMTILDTVSRQIVAATAMRSAGIVLRDDEVKAIEIADFGLGRFAEFGLAIHVYVNTERCCAKELVMSAGQICPEHRHPPMQGDPGKEETFRVRQGEVRLFLPGHQRSSGEREAALRQVPADKHEAFTTYREVHLRPGDQYTLAPDTAHWFVAGPQGAIVSEFSTRSRDEADVFTDPAIRRVETPG